MNYLKFSKSLKKALDKSPEIFTSVTVSDGVTTVVANSYAKRGQKFFKDHTKGKVAKHVSDVVGFRGTITCELHPNKTFLRVKEGKNTLTFES